MRWRGLTTNSSGLANAALAAGNYTFQATLPSGYDILIPFALNGEFTITSGQQTTKTFPLVALGGSSSVVVSQVYSAGGATGAAYNRDFVELFNRGNAAVSLSGWSVQYADAESGTWSVVPLSGALAPGRYFLIGGALGANGQNLPTPNASSSINLATASGKVALVSNTSALTGTEPVLTNIIDRVAYGDAEWFEGTGPTTALDVENAALRLGHGNYDHHDNSWDFTADEPAPRNSSSAMGNRLPVITVPAVQSSLLNAAYTFATQANSPITVTDPDGGLASIQIRLAGDFGTLTLGSTNGLNFSEGDGSEDGVMTFTGNLSSINDALNGLTLTPESGHRGFGLVTIAVDDLGNTGAGGALVTSALAAVVFDGPVVASADSAGTDEDTLVTIDVAANDAWASDVGIALSIVTAPAHGTAIVDDNGTPNDSSDDVILYTPSTEYSGSDTFTYKIDDGLGHTDSAVVALTINELNDAQFRTSALYQSWEGNALDYSFETPSLSQGQSLTWTASGLPAGLSIGAGTGHITGQTQYSAAQTNSGTYSVQVTATATGGDTFSATLPWNVVDVNRIPWQDDRFNFAGDPVVVSFSATDLIGNQLSYDVIDLPPGLSAGPPGSGGWAGVLTAAGTYDVVVTVTGGGATDTREFTWTVLPQNAAGGYIAVNGTLTQIDDVLIVDGGEAPVSFFYRDPLAQGSARLTITEGKATFEDGSNEIVIPGGFDVIPFEHSVNIVPIDASDDANDNKVALWMGQVKVKEVSLTDLFVSFRSDLQTVYDNRVRSKTTPAAMIKDRIAPGNPTWLATHFSLADATKVIKDIPELQDKQLQMGVYGGLRRSEPRARDVDNGIAFLSYSLPGGGVGWSNGLYLTLGSLNNDNNFVRGIVGDEDGNLGGLPRRDKGYQTQPGKADQLTVRVWTTAKDVNEDTEPFNKGVSKPFSVAAIPVAVSAVLESEIRDIVGQTRDGVLIGTVGMVVRMSIKSDSGDGRFQDLEQIVLAEALKTVQDPWNIPTVMSGYFPKSRNMKYMKGDLLDRHLIPIERITKSGILEKLQAMAFKDFRTGPNLNDSGKLIDIPVSNSGFRITYTDSAPGGKRQLVVKKVGVAVNDKFTLLDNPVNEPPNTTWTDKRTDVPLKSDAATTTPAGGLEMKFP